MITKIKSRRELTKNGMTVCAYCDFKAETDDDLAQHESTDHHDNLEDYWLDKSTNMFRLRECKKEKRI